MEFMGIGQTYVAPQSVRQEAPQASQVELYATMAQQQRAIEELRQIVARNAQPQQVAQVQAPQTRGPSPQTFMDISPDAMTEVVWNRMAREQQEEWMRKWQVQ